jgi:hypothetical protein
VRALAIVAVWNERKHALTPIAQTPELDARRTGDAKDELEAERAQKRHTTATHLGIRIERLQTIEERHTARACRFVEASTVEERVRG